MKPFRHFLRKTTKFNSFLHYRSKLANPCLKTTSTNWNVLLYSKLIDTVNFSSTNFLDYGDVWFGDSKSAADLTSTTACIFLLQITLQYSLLNYRSESDKYILFVWATWSTATSLLPSSLFPNVCYISRFVVVNNINIFKSNQDSPCLSIFPGHLLDLYQHDWNWSSVAPCIFFENLDFSISGV